MALQGDLVGGGYNPLAGLSDEELAREASAFSSADALQELVVRYAPKLRRLLFTLMGPDTEMLLDTEQEVFLTLVRKIGRYRGTSRFSTFFYSMAKNRAVDAIRKTRRRARTFRSLPDPDATPDPRTVADGGPEKALLEDE